MKTKHTGILVTGNGQVVYGQGFGSVGSCVGEVCFNTTHSGYQEVLTDPSYANQIILFTFPHIGVVGTNKNDNECWNINNEKGAVGCIVKDFSLQSSSFRSTTSLNDMLKEKNIICLSDVDTRALTQKIRDSGFFNAVIAHDPNGDFDIDELTSIANSWEGTSSSNLAHKVTTSQVVGWQQGVWSWKTQEYHNLSSTVRKSVVVVDYGVKANILRLLTSQGCRVKIVPATSSLDEILGEEPDGVVLSNGPGDPRNMPQDHLDMLCKLSYSGVSVLGICLGHQLLGLSLGCDVKKMPYGHHGVNHPVLNLTTREVEITSMNHCYCVDIPNDANDVEPTHISLFDGTNCGLRLKSRDVTSVQHHPEASAGPKDSEYIIEQFCSRTKNLGAQ